MDLSPRDTLAARRAAAAERSARRRTQRSRLRLGLLAADTVALLLAAGAAALLRVSLTGVLSLNPLGLLDRHVLASVMVVAVLLLLFRQQGLYNVDEVLVGTREYARVANGVTYGLLAGFAASYFAGDGPLVSRSWLLLLWGASIVFTCLGRFAVRRVVRRLRRGGALRTRVAIVGASPLGVSIAERFRAARDEGLDVVGFFDEYLPLGEPVLDDLRVIGRPQELLRGTRQGVADELVLVAQALPHERQQQLMHLLASRQEPRLRMAMGSSDLLAYGANLTERGGVPLVTLGQARIVGLDAVLKRALDLVGASLGLLVLMPLAVVAVARARFAGPGALRQDAPIQGWGGRPVGMWLLAPRVTSWLPLRGAPALLAVLAGRVSLVGPRPVPVGEPAADDESPDLIAVKPGLTGAWRVTGRDASLAEQAAGDLAYVRTYSIWEDLRILWTSLASVWAKARPVDLARWEYPTPPAASHAPLRGAHTGRAG